MDWLRTLVAVESGYCSEMFQAAASATASRDNSHSCPGSTALPTRPPPPLSPRRCRQLPLVALPGSTWKHPKSSPWTMAATTTSRCLKTDRDPAGKPSTRPCVVFDGQCPDHWILPRGDERPHPREQLLRTMPGAQLEHWWSSVSTGLL